VAGLARADRLLKDLMAVAVRSLNLAVDQAVEVSGKGEIVLDADTLRQRQVRGAAAGGAFRVGIGLRAALFGLRFSFLGGLGNLDGLRGYVLRRCGPCETECQQSDTCETHASSRHRIGSLRQT
jgi:hypothetical protein